MACPIFLVQRRDGHEQCHRFASLEEAGLYIEWMNANNPLFPESWEDTSIYDANGRLLWLRVEFGEVKEWRLA